MSRAGWGCGPGRARGAASWRGAGALGPPRVQRDGQPPARLSAGLHPRRSLVSAEKGVGCRGLFESLPGRSGSFTLRPFPANGGGYSWSAGPRPCGSAGPSRHRPPASGSASDCRLSRRPAGLWRVRISLLLLLGAQTVRNLAGSRLLGPFPAGSLPSSPSLAPCLGWGLRPDFGLHDLQWGLAEPRKAVLLSTVDSSRRTHDDTSQGQARGAEERAGPGSRTGRTALPAAVGRRRLAGRVPRGRTGRSCRLRGPVRVALAMQSPGPSSLLGAAGMAWPRAQTRPALHGTAHGRLALVSTVPCVRPGERRSAGGLFPGQRAPPRSGSGVSPFPGCRGTPLMRLPPQRPPEVGRVSSGRTEMPPDVASSPGHGPGWRARLSRFAVRGRLPDPTQEGDPFQRGQCRVVSTGLRVIADPGGDWGSSPSRGPGFSFGNLSSQVIRVAPPLLSLPPMSPPRHLESLQAGRTSRRPCAHTLVEGGPVAGRRATVSGSGGGCPPVGGQVSSVPWWLP